MIIGVCFLLMGILILLNQKYTIVKVGNKRNVETKVVDKKYGLYRYKIYLGIFSIIIGMFSIINYIIY